MRLDRLIQKSLKLTRRQTRAHLATRSVTVNGIAITSGEEQVGPFDLVQSEDKILQKRLPRYIMMNKPIGVVSATSDMEHQTVIDLIEEDWAPELHLAGRLDRFTSGLMVLTNDSVYSRRITRPESKVPKTYFVSIDTDITPQMITAFEKGMSFAKEGIRTQPAIVDQQSPRDCRLTIFEGKHHQVKRMFLRFGAKVISLHRESIGRLQLGALEPGAYRELTAEETIAATSAPLSSF